MQSGRDGHENKAFWNACDQGDVDLVARLLQSQTLDPNWSSPLLGGETPLFVACDRAHLDVVKLLLQDPRIDPGRTQEDQLTPLYIACLHPNPKISEVLLEDGRIDPNVRDKYGRSAFWVACHHGLLDMVKLLLRNPRVDPNLPNLDRMYPLHSACACDHYDLVELLLEDPRVDPNRAGFFGETPLFVACENDSRDAVRMLLASRPHIDTTTTTLQGRKGPSAKGLCPVDVARQQGHMEIASLLERYARNPTQVRQQLCIELGWVTWSSRVFAQVLFVCDELLLVKPVNSEEKKEEEEMKKIKRFFGMATRLHMDLQMVLVNRCMGLSGALISSHDRELAFRDLARHYCSQTRQETT